jgi:hypothetical protein
MHDLRGLRALLAAFVALLAHLEGIRSLPTRSNMSSGERTAVHLAEEMSDVQKSHDHTRPWRTLRRFGLERR